MKIKIAIVVAFIVFFVMMYMYNKDKEIREKAIIKKVDYDKYLSKMARLTAEADKRTIEYVNMNSIKSREDLIKSMQKWAKNNKNYSTGATLITTIGGVVSCIPGVGTIIGAVMVVAGGAMEYDASQQKKKLTQVSNQIVY